MPSVDEDQPLERRSVIRFFPRLNKGGKIPDEIQSLLVSKQADIFGLASTVDEEEDDEGDQADSESD